MNDTTAYVVWTRSDTGQAALWEIDPSLPTGPGQRKRSVYLHSSSGVGGPWQATGFVHSELIESPSENDLDGFSGSVSVTSDSARLQ